MDISSEKKDRPDRVCTNYEEKYKLLKEELLSLQNENPTSAKVRVFIEKVSSDFLKKAKRFTT